MLRVDILPIAEIETSCIVEHDTVTEAKILIEFVQILCVACEEIHLRHHGHHHIQCIGPPPVVVVFRVGLIAHHFFGTSHFQLGLFVCCIDVVEVDVCLETYLPVAKEYIILSFAVLTVFPFLRVWFCGTFPMIMFSPTYAIVQHLLVLQQLIRFNIACVIGRFVPKGSNFSRVVGLPIGVYLSDNVLYLVGSPLSSLCAHG